MLGTDLRVNHRRERQAGHRTFMQKKSVITLLPENAIKHVSEPVFVWVLDMYLL